MSAEPTAEKIDDILGSPAFQWAIDEMNRCNRTDRDVRRILARALAAAVTAEREKYVKLRWDVLTIANELAMIGDVGLNDPLPVKSAGSVAREAARRIREVSS